MKDAMTTSQPVRRRGYHRPRPLPVTETIDFTIDGHAFETDWRDLWVTPPATARVDRIKITRGSVSRSAQRGYPVELFRPDETLSEGAAISMAAFWLAWKDTPASAGHNPVRLDHHQRRHELGRQHTLQEAR